MSEKKKLFDYVIGNPPYQESRETTKDMPVYNYFMDGAYQVGEKVELITPARFLFNAGATPKDWNKKMLYDTHFKVLKYGASSSDFFSNTDIKGGIAITYHDASKAYDAIETFTPYPEMNSIKAKILDVANFQSLSEIIYSPAAYKFSETLHQEHPKIRYREENGKNVGKLSKGNDYMLATNVLEKLPEIFTISPTEGYECGQIIGLVKGKREFRYIRVDYLNYPDNFYHYKIIIPEANGSGAIGEVLSTPLIGTPLIGHTQSFISIGSFRTNAEAEACLKYVKGKFSRALLGILKITQHNQRPTWKYVPLQDFSPSSDIDWSKPISDIDQQLYRKYGLSKEEIDFIESHVKEMS